MMEQEEQKKTKKPVYQKMDPISHIHKRPDMYLGSLDFTVRAGEWIFGEDDRFHWITEPRYSDGLWRIFLEPVSNIIDNCWRSRQASSDCKKIRVEIESDIISLWNDGLFIPIEKNEATGLYNPQLIFGNLLTSSNYNDMEERLSSGRNGLGVKLTNVFSSEFSIECGDPEKGVVYSQTWRNHMRDVEEPVLRKKKNTGYTMLHFKPDLALFGGMETLDATIVGLFRKSCVDMAMTTRVPVFLNEKKMTIHSFKDYVLLFPHRVSDEKKPLMISWDNNDIQKKKEEMLEVVICPSFDDEYHEVAFVNGIYNREGGAHVDAVASEFFKQVLARLNKGRTTHLFSVKDIRSHFSIFVNAMLVNPTFTNQSKTRLNAPVPRVAIDAKHVATVCSKWGFMEKMGDLLKMREMSSLKKTEKKARGYHRIEGLDHANKAGGKDSADCTLILCEGLSAKTYAVTGVECGWNGRKGRDYFGIFALKGKLLNVRNATSDSISGNKEIASIIQALNLKHRTDYTAQNEFDSLSYGRVMIITDADVDGLHIASLILNLFHVLFPSLLRRPTPFLYWMMTPVAKIFSSGPVLTFYNDSDYQKALLERTGTKFKVKYYKGLGTSSDEEVRETFGAKVVSFEADVETDAHMNMVFSKTTANDRKRWMEGYDPDKYETPLNTYAITEFIDQEHIRFSIDDCKRNIPNLYDGLKLSQRKILYSIFKKNLVAGGKSMKVAQLAGYVAETSNYHHGEQCLYDTITRMAQDFVGSNNIPLLSKDGQFGSRSHNGKDAANGRYIFTRMLSLTRLLFPAADDELVPYTLDDGDRVEPDYYVPILPMILVNGCRTGIGSGWSCNVPLYNPLDLMKCVREWLVYKEAILSATTADVTLKQFEMPALVPYYHGFTGRIEQVGETKFRSYGIVEEESVVAPTNKRSKKSKSSSGETHVIREIPIDSSIEKQKDILERLLEDKKLKSMKNYSSPNQPIFCFTPNEGFVPSIETLSLTSDIHLSNMVLFTEQGRLQKYDTLRDIFENYCDRRYGIYVLRKDAMMRHLQAQLDHDLLKRRFLSDVIEDRLAVFRRPEKDILEQMKTMGYVVAVQPPPPSMEEAVTENEEKEKGLGFLLAIPVRQFTRENLEALDKKIEKLRRELADLEKRTPGSMWRHELDVLEKEYSTYREDKKK